MIFQKKIERAQKKLHDESDAKEAERRQEMGESYEPEIPELEKNDFLAMVIAALITIIPVAILVLGGISLLGYFFLVH